MPRPATGSPRWNARLGHWEARVTKPGNVKREPPIPMPGISREDIEGARRMAKLISDRVRGGGAVSPGTGETVTEYAKRWSEARDARGLRSIRADRSRFATWIAPRIGSLAIADVKRRDVEELVEHLDAAVRRGELSWKTAINAWGLATKMLRDSCRSKVLALRVRQDNPAQDVEGPDRGADRDGPYVYPLEFQALLSCERVPTKWKRIATLATYLYLRGGELAALEWSAVNLEQRYVHVYQSREADSGEAKPTKTNRNRKVPIEPTLMPLLEEMHKRADGTGNVVAMPIQREWAKRLRRYLRWGLEDAGIAIRDDLFADDTTRRQLSFHDLRHTGITWRAVRGDEPLKIQRAAGHDDLRTTQRYIEESETFDRAGFGEPFPPLPDALAGEDRFGQELVNWSGAAARTACFLDRSQRRERDSNPRNPCGFT